MGYAYPIDSKVVTNPNGTIDYDRASSSTQLRGLIKSMITNGVNLTESTNLQVMADEETMNLVVKPGYVIIEGALKHFEDDVKVTIPSADTTNPRIDTVVARLNLNEEVRDIVIDVLQGTPSAEPTAPELTRTTSYYEVGLADILVEVGATQISQAVVTDTRLLNSRCGMISAIGEIDTETLFNQLTTDFDNWFESIKGKLGDDVAGGLQMQIDGLADDIDTLQEDVENITPRVETLENNVDVMMKKPEYICLLFQEKASTRTDKTNLPYEFHQGCAVKYRGEIHILGCKDYSKRHYKLNGTTWEQVSTLPYDTVYNPMAVVLNDEIHLFGSANSGQNKNHWKFDGTSWTQLPNLPVGVYGLGHCVFNNEIHVIFTNYHLVYNGETWTTYNLSVGFGTDSLLCVLDDEIHAICMMNGKHYIIDGATLTEMTNFIYSTSGAGIFVANHKIYVVGGASYESKGRVYNGTSWSEVSLGVNNFLNGSLLYDKGKFTLIGGSNTKKNIYDLEFGTRLRGYVKENYNIYLPYHTEAISDNLKVIDDGYEVTEDGFVDILIS